MAGYESVENTGQLAVTATAQQLIAANPNRHRLLVTNTGASAVYIGNSGVTTATGEAIPAGQTLILDETTAQYVIAAAGGNTVTYLEEA